MEMAGLRKGRNEHKKWCLFHGNQRVHSGSRPPIKSLCRNSLPLDNAHFCINFTFPGKKVSAPFRLDPFRNLFPTEICIYLFRLFIILCWNYIFPFWLSSRGQILILIFYHVYSIAHNRNSKNIFGCNKCMNKKYIHTHTYQEHITLRGESNV